MLVVYIHIYYIIVYESIIQLYVSIHLIYKSNCIIHNYSFIICVYIMCIYYVYCVYVPCM